MEQNNNIDVENTNEGISAFADIPFIKVSGYDFCRLVFEIVLILTFGCCATYLFTLVDTCSSPTAMVLGGAVLCMGCISAICLLIQDILLLTLRVNHENYAYWDQIEKIVLQSGMYVNEKPHENKENMGS